MYLPQTMGPLGIGRREGSVRVLPRSDVRVPIGAESRGRGRGYKEAGRENLPQIPFFFHVVSIPIHSWALFNACNTSNVLSLG
jgi:hypothetical protein